MDEIVLDADLKFLMTGLGMQERGELFTALLNRAYEGNNDVVGACFAILLRFRRKNRIKENICAN